MPLMPCAGAPMNSSLECGKPVRDHYTSRLPVWWWVESGEGSVDFWASYALESNMAGASLLSCTLPGRGVRRLRSFQNTNRQRMRGH